MLLRVAYDGGPFSGFALQPTARTVAGELLGAVRSIDPAVSEVRGASRTDAGVHARDQCVAFDPTRSLPPRAWIHELNRNLPKEISVRAATEIARGFVPRFHAREKTYRYLVLSDSVRDPLYEGRVWRIPQELVAVPEMKRELDAILGEHDFAGFRSAADQRRDTVRTIHRATVDRCGEGLFTIDVTGSGFMHNMVRIIVGALVDIARRRLEPGAFVRCLASRDRRDLGITAPPEGLYLWKTDLDMRAGGDDPEGTVDASTA